MGQPQAGPTTVMSEVPSFRVKRGSPPCARMARRKGGTSGVDFGERNPSWMPLISISPPPASSCNVACMRGISTPGGSRRPIDITASSSSPELAACISRSVGVIDV
jgi:hypothetical protein